MARESFPMRLLVSLDHRLRAVRRPRVGWGRGIHRCLARGPGHPGTVPGGRRPQESRTAGRKKREEKSDEAKLLKALQEALERKHGQIEALRGDTRRSWSAAGAE